MQSFTELRKNLKKDFSHLKSLKIALLGDSATQLMNEALRGTGFIHGFNLELWEAEYDRIAFEVFDNNSNFYTFNPDIVLLFQSSHKLLSNYNSSGLGFYSVTAEKQLALIDSLYTTIKSKLKAKVIYYNYPEIDDNVLGSYSNKTDWSFIFQLRKLNLGLMEYAIANSDFYVCDISTIQNQIGKAGMFQASIYFSTDIVTSIGALPLIATKTVGIIAAIYGQFKKCVIVDLDNTLWGGTIGDDGQENIQIGSLGIGKIFTEFQHWLKKLKNRGVILAVCSKNTKSIATAPFEQHPDMVLRLDDFAVFVANWENKADNIRQIQTILNIGFDSMVFLDDNPFERHMVKEQIPEITIPELPDDPAEYLEYLYTLNLFETASFSEQDKERTKHYQIEAHRTITQTLITNEDEFLKSLKMVSSVQSFNAFNTPRVAQLSQRSNQFNLRTVRYFEDDIIKMTSNANIFTFAFDLSDKFGDNGLICVVILKAESDDILFIDSWFMSCRVLKRGMEAFTLNTITFFAKSKRFGFLKGEYLSTAKNKIVENHYSNLGFQAHERYWLLDVNKYESVQNHISKKLI